MLPITLQPPPDDAFQHLRIPAGKHAARPYWLSCRSERLELRFVFTDSCRYVQPHPNHLDWEKLMGLSFNWWTNHRNSGMITWRYNEDLEMVELGVYTHRDGQWQAWFNPDKIDLDLPRREMEVFARVAIGAPVQCYINLIRAENKLAFTLKSPAYYQYIEIPFRARIPKRLRGINPYIGRGGRMALQDTYILRQTI